MSDNPYDWASDRTPASASERRRIGLTLRRSPVIENVRCHEDDLVAEFIGELKLRSRDDILGQNDRPGALRGMFEAWKRAQDRRQLFWASSDWSPDDCDLIANSASR